MVKELNTKHETTAAFYIIHVFQSSLTEHLSTKSKTKFLLNSSYYLAPNLNDCEFSSVDSILTLVCYVTHPVWVTGRWRYKLKKRCQIRGSIGWSISVTMAWLDQRYIARLDRTGDHDSFIFFTTFYKQERCLVWSQWHSLQHKSLHLRLQQRHKINLQMKAYSSNINDKQLFSWIFSNDDPTFNTASTVASGFFNNLLLISTVSPIFCSIWVSMHKTQYA